MDGIHILHLNRTLSHLHASSTSSDRVLDLNNTACKINSTTTTVLNLVFTSTGSERTHEKVRAGGLE